jgi:hypothetical protein
MVPSVLSRADKKRAVYAMKRQSRAGHRKRYVPNVVFSGASRALVDLFGDKNYRALIRWKVGFVASPSKAKAPAAAM